MVELAEEGRGPGNARETASRLTFLPSDSEVSPEHSTEALSRTMKDLSGPAPSQGSPWSAASSQRAS